jgi:hypothetical protein
MGSKPRRDLETLFYFKRNNLILSIVLSLETPEYSKMLVNTIQLYLMDTVIKIICSVIFGTEKYYLTEYAA